jgi:opacity protein-like surface antigen
MKLQAWATTIILLAATPAFAENDSGFYVGAGVGTFDVEIDDIEDIGTTVESFEGDDTAFKVFAGWRFMPWLALELNYIDLGGPEDTIAGQKVEIDLTGFAPYLIGTLPLGPVELFAKVGYYFYDIELNEESIKSIDESDEDLAYGAGIGITFFEHLHARLEYEIIDVSQLDDSNALWLSGAWRF